MALCRTSRWIWSCATAALAACSATVEPTIDQVRQAAERYRDVRVAIAEGYTTDNKCVDAQMLGFPAEQGAMGLHYVRRDLLGLSNTPQGQGRVSGTGTHTDFAKPAMLVYEPRADGSLELVAVENLVFKKAWELAGNDKPPSFRGNPYLLLSDNPKTPLDEAHRYEPHYELHAWVIRENPLGMFAPFNPRVTCEHHGPDSVASSPAGMQSVATQPPVALHIEAAEARRLIRSGAVLVDVRERSELAESGRLKGAVNVPMSRFQTEATSLPRGRPIILYCRSGRRSAAAAEMLNALGYTQLYNLGGFDAAVTAGMEAAGR